MAPGIDLQVRLTCSFIYMDSGHQAYPARHLTLQAPTALGGQCPPHIVPQGSPLVCSPQAEAQRRVCLRLLCLPRGSQKRANDHQQMPLADLTQRQP